MEYIPRYIEQTIQQLNAQFKVLYVGGPRQVGKTTVLQHIAADQQMEYATLDDPQIRALAKKDPALFLQRYQPPVLIDEVQYAPELFPYIKMRVDQSDQCGQYWLTGSQQFSVIRHVQESLAGRVGVLHLLGLSWAETRRLPRSPRPFLPQLISGKKSMPTVDEPSIFQHIHRGSFPAVWQQADADITAFYRSYIQTYVDRDLSSLFGVKKLSEFHIFLQLCAARTGQLLNYSELARDAGISVHAAREWMSILESTMQVYLLRPYYRNISKRLMKSPKLYLLDTGLAAHLTQWSSPKILAAGAMSGAFFETFVVSEIVKSYLFRGQQPPLYFFRDREGHEVDLLIEHEQTLTPIEIKRAASIHTSAAASMNYLRRLSPSGISHGAVISLTPQAIPLDRMTDVLPVSFIQ